MPSDDPALLRTTSTSPRSASVMVCVNFIPPRSVNLASSFFPFHLPRKTRAPATCAGESDSWVGSTISCLMVPAESAKHRTCSV